MGPCLEAQTITDGTVCCLVAQGKAALGLLTHAYQAKTEPITERSALVRASQKAWRNCIQQRAELDLKSVEIRI